MKRTYIIVAVIIVILVVLAIVLSPTDNSQSKTQEKTTQENEKVVINQAAKTLLYLPLYIAKEKGFFEKEGLDAEIVTGGGDSEAFAAVVGGSAFVGQGDPMMAPISRQEGGSGKIVGTVVNRVAFWGVAQDESIQAIDSPEDFKGKTVVTYPRPMTIYALQKKNIEEAGLELGKDTNILQTQFGTELSPLFSGKADITMTLEPVVSQALNRGAHIVYSFPEKYGEYALTGITTTEKNTRNHPERMQHLINAYQRALTYAHNNPEEAIEVAVKEFPDAKEGILDSAVKRMLEERTLPRTVQTTQEAYKKALEVRKSVGDIKNDIPFKTAVDNAFAKKAIEQYGPANAEN